MVAAGLAVAGFALAVVVSPASARSPLVPAVVDSSPSVDVTPPPTVAPTPTPTDTPAPAPTDTSFCNTDKIYGDFVGQGPDALTAGSEVENGDRIHNGFDGWPDGATLSVLIYGTGTNVITPSLTPPTVEWDVDGGPWQSISMDYSSGYGGYSAVWHSPDTLSATIPAHGSRVFRLRMAFDASDLPGFYEGVFFFAAPSCPPAHSADILFGFDPGMATVAPKAGSNPAVPGKPAVAGSVAPSPGPAPPSPSAGSSSTPAELPSVALAAAASGGVSVRLVGAGTAAGLCGLLAILQFVRWRRVSLDDRGAD